MGERLYHRLATRNAVRLVLAPALVFIAASLDRGYQTDFWQHLARGRLIATEHAVVSADRFTYTVPGRPFVDNNWLSQLLYYAVHEVGGLQAVQFLNSAVLAATFAVLVRLCRRTSGSTGVAAAAGVVAFFGLWQTFLIRPQSFSMLLFVATHSLLEAGRRRPRLLLWIPPVLALWANVHGGFAVGLALVFAFAVGAAWERLRTNPPLPPAGEGRGEGEARGAEPRSYANEPSAFTPHPNPLPQGGRGPEGAHPFALLACLAVSAVSTLANPYGWNVYRYAGNLSSVGVARGIEEWLPPSLTSLNGCALAASIVLAIVLIAASRRRLVAKDVCLLACFAVPACLSTRMTVWWFLASAPVLARLSAAWTPLRSAGPAPDRASPFAAAALATITFAALLSLPWLEHYHPAMGALRPARRTETDLQAIADQLPRGGGSRSRVFTRLEWANYLTWSASDRAAVFAEGRIELYPDDTWRQYLAVSEGGLEWERVVDGYDVDYLLLDEAYHRPLIDRVEHSAQWSRQSRAGSAVLFARRRGAAPDAPATPPADPPPDLAGVDF
jgi:hypothetical protein